MYLIMVKKRKGYRREAEVFIDNLETLSLYFKRYQF